LTTTIQCDRDGERLDAALSRLIPGLNRSAAQRLLEGGLVTSGGAVLRKSGKTVPGLTVTVDLPDPQPVRLVPQDIPLDVRYEDDDLIVVNKPKGLVVHPAAGHPDETLVNALLFHCGASLSGINGELRPGIVHRIDKDTSGLLVAAKNDAAHLSLAEQIKEHKVSRVYYALAIGGIAENRTVDLPIGRHPADRKKMAVTMKNSKHAVTHIEVLERFPSLTYVRCILETGRTHQIRVHLSHIGHPLLGDFVYGSPKLPMNQKYGGLTNGQALHAGELTLTHPRTGETMHFACALPAYFEKLLETLSAAGEK